MCAITDQRRNARRPDTDYYLNLTKAKVMGDRADILGIKLLCNGSRPCEPTWVGSNVTSLTCITFMLHQ